MEEQTATSNKVGRNGNKAASGSEEIAEKGSSVASVAQDTPLFASRPLQVHVDQ